MENGNGVMYKIVIASAIMKQKTKQKQNKCVSKETLMKQLLMQCDKSAMLAIFHSTDQGNIGMKVPSYLLWNPVDKWQIKECLTEQEQ